MGALTIKPWGNQFFLSNLYNDPTDFRFWERWHQPPYLMGDSSSAHNTKQYPCLLFSLLFLPSPFGALWISLFPLCATLINSNNTSDSYCTFLDTQRHLTPTKDEGPVKTKNNDRLMSMEWKFVQSCILMALGMRYSFIIMHILT